MEDEDMVNIFETDWYKKINSTTTPGEVLKIYRQNAELTQEELGRKLGKFSRQKISDLENGKRTIGKEVAKKLCQLFQVPVERFL
ncbi:MAG: helix-turn-helix transcriptional regulator [Candidatus Aminicenantes bacterium]|nr:helix-turn-helix transcriptional regulator [Candidatus Aminicenantes bacterium]